MVFYKEFRRMAVGRGGVGGFTVVWLFISHILGLISIGLSLEETK